MEITAAVVHEQGSAFSVEPLELEPPREGELIVRIVATGMCHTDLICRDRWYPVPLPIVLGHEGAGVVEEVGSGVTKLRPGDHVVLTFLPCGACLNCQRGRPAYCLSLYELNFGGARPDGSTTLRTPDGRPVHGRFFGQSSFGTHALAAERNTVKVPTDIPLELLGPLGCGVQTGAGTVLNSLRPEIGASLVVFGAGAVGLSAVMAAKVAACAPIVAVDLKPNRLELATELGASHTVNAGDADPVEAIVELTGGGANYAVDTTGSPAALRQATDALAQLGTCALVGAAPMGAEATVDIGALLFGKSVRGVIEGDSVPDLFIPQLIQLYKEARFPFDRLVKPYPLAEINAAARDSEAGDTLKPVLRPTA